MPRSSILVVEDEEDIRELICFHLEEEGYAVRSAEDGVSALMAVAEQPPDLIVLDLMLPGISGQDVCRKVRATERLAEVPIVMVTAMGEEPDEIAGLGLGADDYIAKPFSPRVLVARINSLLRRSSQRKDGTEQDIIERGPLRVDRIRHEVTLDDAPVHLTPIEFKILVLLTRSIGRVFSRGQIISSVLGEDVIITERTIDVHLVALRRKLGTFADRIETVRGVGYRFRE